MKYSEFTKILNDHGYVVENLPYDLYVVSPLSGNRLMCIDKEDNHAICTDYVAFLNRTNEEKDFLLDIGTSLAKTPLEDREEDKRYCLLAKLPLISNQEKLYLNKHYTGKYILSDIWEDDCYTTKFTEAEIAEMNTKGFEKIEVIK